MKYPIPALLKIDRKDCPIFNNPVFQSAPYIQYCTNIPILHQNQRDDSLLNKEQGV